MVHDKHDVTLLLTRPSNEVEEMMRALIQRGFKVIVDPMLHIRPVDCPPLNLKNVQALVTTSINGIRRLSQLTPHRHVPFYVVGDVSAHQARQMGFNAVYAAQGSVDHLARLLIEKLNPSAGKIIYVSGQEIKKDLVHLLSTHGYDVERIIAYHALAASSLKSETQEALITGRLNAVLFFSPRTAEVFVTLTRAYAKAFERIVALCLSSEVVKPLKAYIWQETLISPERSGRSMMYTLENYFETREGREKNDICKTKA